jgi:hypothetical protein
MANLLLAAHERPGVVDIAVLGPLTADTNHHVRETLNRHSSTVTRLRLRACTAIDHEGPCALLLAHIEAGEAGGSVHLVEVPPLIEHYVHRHNAGHLLH